jgi:hypothetical protein
VEIGLGIDVVLDVAGFDEVEEIELGFDGLDGGEMAY